MDFTKTVSISFKQISAFTHNEILKIVGESLLQEIKAKDPHPYFKAYVVAHEGTSNPRIIGETARPITWTRKAIQSIRQVLSRGIKFFSGHGTTNSHEGRVALGEVVANTEMVIDGKLSTVVIGYYPPEHREEVKNYDVCSQESVWSFIESAGKLFADSLQEMTGIALANSSVEAPAFAGAKTIGFVQAFDQDNENQPKANAKEMPKMEITFKDVQNYIRDHNVWPWQVFSIEQMKSDRDFGPLIVKGEKFDDEVKNLAEKFGNEKKELTGKIDELTRQGQAVTAKQRLAKILADPNSQVTDNQKKWIEKAFKEDMDDLSDEGIASFIDEQKKLCQDFLVEFGIEKSVPNPSGDRNLQDKPLEEQEVDYTDPENNPLI
jgi:hypothetical protein